MYCTVFLLHCLVNILPPYGIAWYCIVWFGILCYLFCILLRFSLRHAGFVSQDAYSLHPPIWLSPPIWLIWIIWLSRPIRMNPPFWLSPPIRLILIIRIIQLNPSIRLVICYLSLVIGHLSFGFFICHLFICYLLHCCLLHCLVYILLPYGIAWYCIIWFGISCYRFCVLLRCSFCRAGCVSQDAFSLNDEFKLATILYPWDKTIQDQSDTSTWKYNWTGSNLCIA